MFIIIEWQGPTVWRARSDDRDIESTFLPCGLGCIRCCAQDVCFLPHAGLRPAKMMGHHIAPVVALIPEEELDPSWMSATAQSRGQTPRRGGRPASSSAVRLHPCFQLRTLEQPLAPQATRPAWRCNQPWRTRPYCDTKRERIAHVRRSDCNHPRAT